MRSASGGRLAYERAIRRSTLPPGARHVALTVATWADIDSGVIPDRFQPSLSTLAEATGLGKSSIKRNLTVLEEGGWLVRIRPDGDKARTEHARTAYRLQVPGAQVEARPTVGLGPDGAQPGPTMGQDLGPDGAMAGPTVGHKSPLSSGSASSLSPDRPEPAAASERETTAPPQKPTAAQRALRSGGLLAPEEEQPFIVWATAKFNIQSPGWWVRCEPDLPEHVDTWRSTLVVHQRAPSLPPWCGSCAEGWTAAQFNPRLRMVDLLGKPAPCPDCHPDAVAA